MVILGVLGIISFTVIVIVLISYKYSCRHKWIIEDKLVYIRTDYVGNNGKYDKYIMKCEKCGKLKTFDTI